MRSRRVESFEVEDAPGGTRVRWTLAIEPRLLQRLAAPLAPLLMRRLFERAMRNLEARHDAHFTASIYFSITASSSTSRTSAGTSRLDELG